MYVESRKVRAGALNDAESFSNDANVSNANTASERGSSDNSALRGKLGEQAHCE